MTPITVVYDAFYAKILEDEWDNELFSQEQREADLNQLLKEAIPQFKFPRVDLTIIDNSFVGDLTDPEIQILATYMKCAWLNRTLLTWENVKPLYEEKDFSQANLIDKFTNLLKEERKNGQYMERIYYRSRNGKPFEYSRLAKN